MADQENEQRIRLEMAAAVEATKLPSEEVIKKNKINQKKQQVKIFSLNLNHFL